jgi:hypothetical protein
MGSDNYVAIGSFNYQPSIAVVQLDKPNMQRDIKPT